MIAGQASGTTIAAGGSDLPHRLGTRHAAQRPLVTGQMLASYGSEHWARSARWSDQSYRHQRATHKTVTKAAPAARTARAADCALEPVVQVSSTMSTCWPRTCADHWSLTRKVSRRTVRATSAADGPRSRRNRWLGASPYTLLARSTTGCAAPGRVTEGTKVTAPQGEGEALATHCPWMYDAATTISAKSSRAFSDGAPGCL